MSTILEFLSSFCTCSSVPTFLSESSRPLMYDLTFFPPLSRENEFFQTFCFLSSSQDLPILILLMFVSEGDNVPDALSMADQLNSWLNLIVKKVLYTNSSYLCFYIVFEVNFSMTHSYFFFFLFLPVTKIFF